MEFDLSAFFSSEFKKKCWPPFIKINLSWELERMWNPLPMCSHLRWFLGFDDWTPLVEKSRKTPRKTHERVKRWICLWARYFKGHIWSFATKASIFHLILSNNETSLWDNAPSPNKITVIKEERKTSLIKYPFSEVSIFWPDIEPGEVYIYI